jgi:hypothetical protein
VEENGKWCGYIDLSEDAFCPAYEDDDAASQHLPKET